MEKKYKLIVGLGNPGRAYKSTRHNVGFMFVDNAIKDFKQKFTLDKAKKCEIAFVNIENQNVIFIKPQTYMNASGEAVNIVKKYYNIDKDDILVIYDDMDLDVGRVRIRPTGTSGGHKGMQSIIDNVNDNAIKRVKIGISHGNDSINHVLGKFSKDEKITIDLICEKAYDICTSFVVDSFDHLMNRYNNHE